ncbi:MULTISPECIES: dihydrolipoamide acetyltransferase family protein [Anaerolinea]|uniref:dihydrolipoamide acetyltransferase family protein n=1 Tax=Anaerolinea TaxID=233189 RepID=UPI00260983F8|nr:dihydrolipoamide acetyltransferase family protein [Anaerolinea thermophila]
MAETIKMPKLGFDMQEGTLVRWVRQEGEAIEKGQVLAEIETDKATVEVETTVSGVVYRHLVEQGAIVPVGTPIAIITAPGEVVSEEPTSEVSPKASTEESVEMQPSGPASGPVIEEVQRIKASPLAKRLAQEHQIDLNAIRGSGPGGRVVRKDIEAYLEMIKTSAPKPSEVAGAAPPEPVPPSVILPVWTGMANVPADEVVTMDRLRQAIGRRMVDSKQNYPHFYVTRSFNVEALLSLREQINQLMPDGQKLTLNDFVIKAVALALRNYPNLNASVSGTNIVRHGHVNIGVAVAVEGGLLTVVCKDADLKPVRTISAEIRDMVSRARQGKVRPEDIEGSTFSISNLGMFDVEHFVAIINPPESAILAVGAAQKVPVVVGDEIKPGIRMKATLSADHRVTDGAEAAQFMQALARYIENPVLLLV